MAGDGGGGEHSLSLEETPTWAVAVVCFGFVFISIIIEESIHHLGKWLLKHHKKALNEALEKIKAELMLLGFISLLLTVGQKSISKICISQKLAKTMVPCRKEDDSSHKTNAPETDHSLEGKVRKFLWEATSSSHEGRILAGGGGSNYCFEKNMAPLISEEGIHQLHIFIFVLAVFHVLCSVLTMGLGRAKMLRWKAWEKETRTPEYQSSHDPARLRYTHETSFVRRHKRFWSETKILIWIVCFFRQFFRSVTKVDYLTLRHGFITAHLTSDSKFDFHKYIKRSLQDDFKDVVGISPPLWAFAMIFLLLNGYDSYTYFWLPFVPLIIILLVGTKLQVIIAKLALEIHERHATVQGTPVVRPSNELFWFGRPRWILFLIHFTLFQNAFEVALYFWTWWQFGPASCFHGKIMIVIIRVAMGIFVQLLCGYITLPLYALVTQMGSHMKKAIFDDQTAKAVERWHQTARKHKKQNRDLGVTPGFITAETIPSQGSSPFALLRRSKTMADPESIEISQRFFHSEYEMSDLETSSSSQPPPQHSKSVRSNKANQNTQSTGESLITEDAAKNNDDLSFEKV